MPVSLLRLDRRSRRSGEITYRDAAEVARRLAPEEPFFCFSAAQLTGRTHMFQTGFPGEVSYAVKANSSGYVLDALARCGIAVWDVASVHEMKAVCVVSPQAVFHYHNPVKSRAEIAESFKTYGCRRFAVDDDAELRKIASVLGKDKDIEIAVRFVLPRAASSSAHDFSSKFGATEAQAVNLLWRVRDYGYAPLLTFHPGSQCKAPDAYVRHIEAAARIASASAVPVSILNVGGGFPANYLASPAASPSVFFTAITDAVDRAFGEDRLPRLECEPGRGLVATSTSLLASVKLIRSGRDEIFLNDGIYGALLECWQVPELAPPCRAIRDGKVLPAAKTRAFTVFGPTCDPLDRLPGQLDLPADLREGDYIEFGNIGAYGSATLTAFNGYGDHGIVQVERAFSI